MIKKKILVVDNSAIIRRYIIGLLKNAGYEVDFSKNAYEALEKLRQDHFSLVILDMNLPDMNGLEALRQIMKQKPTRVLIMSTQESNSAKNSFEALDIGAIDYIAKPKNSVDIASIAEEFLQKVKKALLVLPKNIVKKSITYTPKADFISDTNIDMGIVLIGASTGGPRLIEAICKNLPQNYPHALCVVQHMPVEFTQNFAKRLNSLSQVEVVEAQNGIELQPSRVIIAKGGFHMHFRRKLKKFSVSLAPNTRERFFVPSVDEMFLSALETLPVQSILAVELTGIGDDGADGLVELRKKGAYTLAESEESAVVYGMPKEAALRGGACKVLDFDKILEEIIQYGNTQP